MEWRVHITGDRVAEWRGGGFPFRLLRNCKNLVRTVRFLFPRVITLFLTHDDWGIIWLLVAYGLLEKNDTGGRAPTRKKGTYIAIYVMLVEV